MSRQFSGIFIFIITLLFYQSVNASLLTLNNKQIDYNIAPYTYIISDKAGEFSVQDIALRYRNNVRGIRNKEETITLPSPQTKTWIAFEFVNNSNREHWILDFGQYGAERSGINKKVYIYNASTRQILYDGLYNKSKTAKLEQKMTVQVKKRERSLFIMYLEPGNYKNFKFSPKLLAISATKKSEYATLHSITNIAIKNLPNIIMASIGVLTISFFISKFIPFLPIIFFYIVFGAWYSFYETPFFNTMIGTDILINTIPIIFSVIVLCIGLSFSHMRNGGSTLHYIQYFLLALSFLAFYVVTSLKFNYGISHLAITYGLLLSSCIFAALHIYNSSSILLRTVTPYIIAWISLFIIGQTMIILNFSQLSTNLTWLNHADHLILYPQFMLIFLCCVGSIRSDIKRRILYVTRKSQKTQELLKAQKSKESSDHSRLLRVIEREREIMEELRGRESERAEEMRQAKIEADEANQAQTAFLAIVSHEIRTPMTGVMGMLRLLQDTPLNDEQKNYLLTIQDSGDAMVSLLNDILDFSKIKDGGMTLEEINFDLHRVTNGVMMLMKGHADQKNIELILDIDPSVPETLNGDPTRLRQVFLNLIGNALKFTERGHVALRIKTENNKSPDKINVKFIIEDTGIGISKEAQEKLFTPFSQADDSISRKYGGTGLGLTICQKLINAMGAKIEIESTENVGTQFFFTIPFKNSQIKESEKTTIETEEYKSITPKKVLIVDDNDVNQKVITSLLSQKHHTFSTASSGQEALDILSKESAFDIILLDIEMPDMNGKDVAVKILSDDKINHIPIIALTGNVGEDDINSYSDIGFEGHLAKPVNPEKLYEIVNSAEDLKPFTIKPHRHTPEISEADLEEDSFMIAEAKFIEQEKKKNTSDKNISTLDKAMLAGLKDGLGVAQTQDLLKDLYIKADEILEQMQQSMSPFTLDDLRARAHELKGMAGNFGLKAISEQSGEMEKMCKQDTTKPEDIHPRIEELHTLLERSKIAVDKFLER